MTDRASLTIVLANKHPRQCGGCTLCCKLLPISPDLYPPERVNETVDGMIDAGWAKPSDFAGMVREWKKPAGEPCKHQRHGKGCAIYERRPFCCRTWSCRWLTGDGTADLRRPDRSRYVIDLVPDFITLRPHDGSEPTNIEVVQIWVDPATPDAWRDDPALLAYIEARGKEGKAALIRLDNKKGISVFPPSMSQDGQWHEVHNGELSPEHVGTDLIRGLAATRKVKVGGLTMGVAFCTSSCVGCGRLFNYNPMRVPSVTVKGSREPICEGCVARVNPMRIANGLAPIVPLPDAYEPCDESELG